MRAAELDFLRQPSDAIDRNGDSLASRTARLRYAVKQGGGHKAVAEKANLNGRTLSHLLAGQDAKVEQILSIARATGFSVEWLMTGLGPGAEGLKRPNDSPLAGSGSSPAPDWSPRPVEELLEKVEEAKGKAQALDLDAVARGEVSLGPVARLTLAVQEAGSVMAVARRSKLKPGILRNYLAGFDVNPANLPAIAEATGVRLEWLATGRGPMRAGEPEAPSALSRPTSGIVAVPRYDARAAAGRAGSVGVDGTVIQRVEFSEVWLRTKLRRNPANLVLLEVLGDSMEPTIAEGDVLMLDRATHNLVTGRIYVLQLGDELVVKRVSRRASGGVTILSDNPRYPPEDIPAADAATLRVLGEVVWHARAV